MKDLCKAMGIEWHDIAINLPRVTCSCGVAWQGGYSMGDFMGHKNPSPTDPAFCWRALTYMAQRADWGNFYQWVEWKQMADEARRYWYNTIKWLLSDPARFIELADEWCREHEEVESD